MLSIQVSCQGTKCCNCLYVIGPSEKYMIEYPGCDWPDEIYGMCPGGSVAWRWWAEACPGGSVAWMWVAQVRYVWCPGGGVTWM